MGKSIVRWDLRSWLEAKRSSATPPPPIVSMSLPPAIPWPVALQQSPPPLHRLAASVKDVRALTARGLGHHHLRSIQYGNAKATRRGLHTGSLLCIGRADLNFLALARQRSQARSCHIADLLAGRAKRLAGSHRSTARIPLRSGRAVARPVAIDDLRRRATCRAVLRHCALALQVGRARCRTVQCSATAIRHRSLTGVCAAGVRLTRRRRNHIDSCLGRIAPGSGATAA